MSIHIGNLHHDAHKGDLEHAFNRYGRIRSMWIARSPPGFAFVEFDDVRDAEDAIRDMDGREMLGRRVRVQMKRGQGEGGGSRREQVADNSRKPTRSEHRIIISGLSNNINWKDLKNLLKEKTEPVYVDFRGEGKAVAEFVTADDISVAIDSFSGQEFQGSTISIVKDETGGDERSDSWQKFDTRPKRGQGSRGSDRNRDRDRDGGRARSRSRERPRRDRSRSRSRDRRYHDDRRGGYDGHRRGRDDYHSRNDRDRFRDQGGTNDRRSW